MITLARNATLALVPALSWLMVTGTATPAAAQDNYVRPCQASDLPGLWEVVHWSSHLPDARLNSYAAPYQWYLFGSDGTLRSVTSTRPSDDAAKIRETLERLPVVIHYTCPRSGEVSTARTDDPSIKETWQAFYVTFDTVDSTGQIHLEAGDVVMALLDREGKPIYTRQMRELGGTQPRQLGPR